MAIPLEPTEDISELTAEITTLEKLQEETAKSIEVQSLHSNLA